MEASHLYRLIDNTSILAIKQNGKLVRIHCPFPVINDKQVILTVDAITQGNDGFPYYLIDGSYYRYSLFLILMRN